MLILLLKNKNPKNKIPFHRLWHEPENTKRVSQDNNRIKEKPPQTLAELQQ